MDPDVALMSRESLAIWGEPMLEPEPEPCAQQYVGKSKSCMAEAAEAAAAAGVAFGGDSPVATVRFRPSIVGTIQRREKDAVSGRRTGKEVLYYQVVVPRTTETDAAAASPAKTTATQVI